MKHSMPTCTPTFCYSPDWLCKFQPFANFSRAESRIHKDGKKELKVPSGHPIFLVMLSYLDAILSTIKTTLKNFLIQRRSVEPAQRFPSVFQCTLNISSVD